MAIRILIKTRVLAEPPANAVNPTECGGWTGFDSKPNRVESQHSARERTYLVRLKGSDLGTTRVMAARAEIHGDHLVFLRSDGRLVALFVTEVVQNWHEA